jgi:hypothetical protein
MPGRAWVRDVRRWQSGVPIPLVLQAIIDSYCSVYSSNGELEFLSPKAIQASTPINRILTEHKGAVSADTTASRRVSQAGSRTMTASVPSGKKLMQCQLSHSSHDPSSRCGSSDAGW